MTEEILAPEISSDEKLMAALVYWGNLVLGFIPALIIYFLKKDESRFIKKHCLQCLLFHVAVIVISIALFFVMNVIIAIPFLGWIIGLLASPVYAAFFLGYWVYSAYLGYRVFIGHDINIPKISEIVQQYLNG